MIRYALPLLLAALSATAADITVTVLPQPLWPTRARIGVNLGDWTGWGAGQLMHNVLKNPGFEGTLDRALVLVTAAGSGRVRDDQPWLGREDGFWSGSQVNVLTGPSAGQTGKVYDSQRKSAAGLPEYQISPTLTVLPSDVLSLTRVDDVSLPSHWQLPAESVGRVRTVDDSPPGSPGRRSLLLEPLGKPVVVSQYLDSLSRAGKLLPVNGDWRLTLWLRGAGVLRLRLLRQSVTLLDTTLSATADWQRLEIPFTAVDNGPPGSLELRLEAGGTGAVQVDELELAAATAAGGFRPEIVALLRELRPGYLRDWQGQLGDTWENRVQPLFARRSTRYRPAAPPLFLYGLPEFLQLARAVGAQPWVVMPTTLTAAEWAQARAYFAGQAFAETVLEVGNENWNALFRPAGLPEWGRYAELVRAVVGEGRGIKLAVNAPFYRPDEALQLAAALPQADVIAVSAYFLQTLNAADGPQPWPKLFARSPQLDRLQTLGERLAVAEINLHTVSGDADLNTRNRVVTSAAAGAALAAHLVDLLNSGAARVCVYTLLQFDTQLPDNGGLLRLWGMARDAAATPRLRPTGLALALLNRVLPGEIMTLTAPAEPLRLLAVRGAAGYGLVAVNASAEPQRLRVRFPADAPAPRWTWTLAAPSPEAHNEDTPPHVTLQRTATQPTDGVFTLNLAPWGLAALGAAEEGVTP